MTNSYSESYLVQDSAAHLLETELGWDVALAYNTETLGEGGTFGRVSHREALLKRDLRAALKRLNSWITPAQIDEAVRTFESHMSTASLMQINEEKYFLIRDGIPVTVRKPRGRTEEKRAAVIDFRHAENNRFLAVKELWMQGDVYRKRADMVGFVNGIPLVFMEFKRHDIDVQDAYNLNYSDYLDTVPQFFHYNAFVILSNAMQAKVGTIGSKYEFFHEWKRLSEGDAGKVELKTMLMGICRKENLLDLLENFILYDHSGGRTVKILARNHQYLGVNEAVSAYEARKINNGKLGVFWHTQGSGKSYSMAFLAQKIRRKFQGSPTIVVLTDREELNTQISDTFENCGLLGKVKSSQFIAQSGSDLMEKLRGNPSFIFTLIQKFNMTNIEPICPDHDIIIMSDEAHRSQYGIFADNMMNLLPTASRIGFTGTPLLSDDNITERTFGGYISVYDFKRAVEDGATVPLYYENRGEQLQQLRNPEITERILDAIEQAEMDVERQEKLEREFAKEIHLLTAEARLDAIAKDFVGHYSELWTSGKAMFVCLNKVTCVRMYHLVQKYWAQAIEDLKRQIQRATQQDAQELEKKLAWMQETEMAVVISQEQNEQKIFRKWGLDILPHRIKMEKRKLDKEFKDADNPFRVVFVCAMWLTGFDVKSLSCLYLDKPLKAHTLMQTIARANRVSEGKSNGLIVDYIGIVKALRKALADYTANVGAGGSDPTVDKEKLVAKIMELIGEAEKQLCQEGFSLKQLTEAEYFEKASLLKEAANALCVSLTVRKAFCTCAAELMRLVKYCKREELSEEAYQKRNAIYAIYRELGKRRSHADNTDLMVQINEIVSEYVQVEAKAAGQGQSKQFDISKIDFDMLRREFGRTKKKNLMLKDLQELIGQRLAQMLEANPSRMDYYVRYQNIIAQYNAEQDRAAIEKTFIELIELANSMDIEQQRYVRMGFKSDEELSMYDLLFSENLSKKDIEEIKKVAVTLLSKVKRKIAELDHWTDKQETKAIIDNLIRDTLWSGLPESYDEISISGYRQKVYEYVYTRYRYAS